MFENSVSLHICSSHITLTTLLKKKNSALHPNHHKTTCHHILSAVEEKGKTIKLHLNVEVHLVFSKTGYTKCGCFQKGNIVLTRHSMKMHSETKYRSLKDSCHNKTDFWSRLKNIFGFLNLRLKIVNSIILITH